jgi:hypothetical protein
VHSFQQALGDAYLVGLALSLSVLAAAALLPGGRAAEHVWRAPAETGVEAG